MAQPRSEYPAYPPDLDPQLQLFLEAIRQKQMSTDLDIGDPSLTVRVLSDGSVLYRATVNAASLSIRTAKAVGAAPSWPSDATVEAGTVRVTSAASGGRIVEWSDGAGTVPMGEVIRVRAAAYVNVGGTGPGGVTDHALIVDAEAGLEDSLAPKIDVLTAKANANGSVDYRVVTNSSTLSIRTATDVAISPSWPNNAAVEAGTIRATSADGTSRSVEWSDAAATIAEGQRLRIRAAPYINANGTGPSGATDHGIITGGVTGLADNTTSGSLLMFTRASFVYATGRLPSAALSLKWAAATDDFPAAGSGATVNVSAGYKQNLGSFVYANEVYCTITPYTATDAGGVQLPAMMGRLQLHEEEGQTDDDTGKRARAGEYDDGAYAAMGDSSDSTGKTLDVDSLGTIHAGQIWNAASDPTAGLILTGSVPGTMVRYIDLTATGIDEAFIEHPALTCWGDGDAVFSGTLYAAAGTLGVITAGLLRDANSRFILDLDNQLFTVKDDSDVLRVQIGEIVAGTTWGIKLYEDDGTTLLWSLVDAATFGMFALRAGIGDDVGAGATGVALRVGSAFTGSGYRMLTVEGSFTYSANDQQNNVALMIDPTIYPLTYTGLKYWGAFIDATIPSGSANTIAEYIGMEIDSPTDTPGAIQKSIAFILDETSGAWDVHMKIAGLEYKWPSGGTGVDKVLTWGTGGVLTWEAVAGAAHDHDEDYLGLHAQADDSDKLDGEHANAFSLVEHHHDADYADIDHDHAAADITSGTIASARISGSYTGITGVGTIAAGVWQGTDIAAEYLAAHSSSHDDRFYTETECDETFAAIIHNLVDTTYHPVSGLTPGHFLKATGAAAYAFAAHGLSYGDVGAAASGHDHDADYLGINDQADDSDKLDGSHAAAFSVVEHLHDGRYYTEGEVDGIVADYLPLTGGTLTGTVEINDGGQGIYINDEGAGFIWDASSNKRAGLIKQAGYGPEIRYLSSLAFIVRRVTGGTLISPSASGVVMTFGTGGVVDFASTPTVSATAVSLAGHTHDSRYYTETECDETFAEIIHDLVDTTAHPVSGLTTGHFLKATGATSYAFAAHGLSYSDVGAASSGHNHSGVYLGISATAADSDKLDGSHAAAFSLVEHLHDARYYTESEVNALWRFKIYDNRAAGDVTPDNYQDNALSLTFTDDIAGSPNAWDSVLTMKGWGDTYSVWQLLSNSTIDDVDTNLYFRHGRTASWGSLQKVWTDANDGSGSGLDADKLDNQHGSYYSVSGHDHDGDYSALGHNHDIRYYTETECDETFLGIAAQAADAHTVDGSHASAFATSGHNHSGVYLPIGGGTLTGTLTTRQISIQSGYTLGVPSTSAECKLNVYGAGTYGLGMVSGITYGYLNDWAMTFGMNNAVNRGFWWGYTAQTKSDGAMSLTTDGRLYLKAQMSANYFISRVSTGTAPLQVSSTTKCTNLNADLLDGESAGAFANASHAHATGDITSGTFVSARLSGSYTGITAVGTISSGTWQGDQIAAAYIGNLPANKITSGTIATARIVGAYNNITGLGTLTQTLNTRHVQIGAGYSLGFNGGVTFRLYYSGGFIYFDDGSTNDARLASVVISSSPASGDYPYGTIWLEY